MRHLLLPLRLSPVGFLRKQSLGIALELFEPVLVGCGYIVEFGILDFFLLLKLVVEETEVLEVLGPIVGADLAEQAINLLDLDLELVDDGNGEGEERNNGH